MKNPLPRPFNDIWMNRKAIAHRNWSSGNCKGVRLMVGGHGGPAFGDLKRETYA
jgi:hypothetical protein